MIRLSAVAAGLAFVLILGSAAWAHHSITANFDTSRTIEIHGSVVDFNYVSPHASMVIDGIAYEDGTALSEQNERWEIESSAVKGLAQRGIRADTFEPGDRIVVRGAPHRNASLKRANSSDFRSADGGPLNLEAPSRPVVDEAPAADGVELVAGRWTPPFQPAGETSALPLNAAGLAAWEAYEQAGSPANTCEPMSIPVVMNAPSYYIDVRFGDGEVVVRNEAYDVHRTVPLGDSFAPADPDGQWGNVRGRIEGDSLVIESRDYPPSQWGLGAATQINGGGADVPSSAEKTVVERFSTSPDGLTLIYEYELFDPVYMSRAHTASIEMRRVADDALMVPYDCNVDAARQFSRAPGESLLSTDE